MVAHNPYCLATDIRGIGFRSADKIAGSLGIDMRSPIRAHAGILHALDVIQSEGHVYYPRTGLLEKARELLGIDFHTLERALDELTESRECVIEEDRVYPASMAAMENSVRDEITEPHVRARFLPPIKIDAAIEWIQKKTAITLSPAQRTRFLLPWNIKY